MKQRGIRRWLGVAVVPLTLLMLGVASPAQAESFNCSNVQSNPQDGIIEVFEAGNCTINSDLVADNDITINVGGTLTVKGLTSNNGNINITSNGNTNLTGNIMAMLDVHVTVNGTGTLDVTDPNLITSTDGEIVIEANGDTKLDGPEVKSKNKLEITVNNDSTLDAKKLTSTDLNIKVSVDGDVTITNDVMAKEDIVITATKGSVTTMNVTSEENGISLISQKEDVESKDISAGLYAEILAGIIDGTQMGKIVVDGEIRSNTDQKPLIPMQGTGANVLLRAQSTIKTKSIFTNGNAGVGSSTCGGIQIDANQHQTNNVNFTIGDTVAGENGVGGVLDTRSVSGGGDDDVFHPCGIRITNGQSATGSGITVDDVSNFLVTNTASKGDVIILDAQSGNLIFNNGGILDVSGAANQSAGRVFLLADTIITGSDFTIDTNQDDMAPDSLHGVTIAANRIEFSGNDGLKILADGDGLSTNVAGIIVVPKEGVTSTSTNEITDLDWDINLQQFGGFPGSVTFAGAGTSPLTLQADGDDTLVAVVATDTRFEGGQVDIQAKTKNGTSLILLGFSQPSSTSSLTFFNFGDVSIFARGEGAGSSGGDITLEANSIALNAVNHNVTIKANGPQSKDGNGGTIRFVTENYLVNGSTRVKFDADASVQNSGFAQKDRNGRKAIYFESGSNQLVFGTLNGHTQFSAKGGQAGGNGGAIEIQSTGNIRIRPKPDVIDVSALAGDGGEVFIEANNTVFVPSDFVMINAAGNEQGGKIEINKVKAHSSSPGIINVNAFMDVRGGITEPATTFFGDIKLNGVLCEQFSRGPGASWPKTYWQCGDSLKADRMVDGAVLIDPGLRNILGDLSSLTLANPEVQIYAMKSQDNYNDFFDRNLSGSNFGVSVTQIRISAVFDESAGGTQTVTESTIIHELGHQLDYIFGNLSAQSAYTTAYNDDKTNFDNLDCFNPSFPTFSAFNGIYATLCIDFPDPTTNHERLLEITDFSIIEAFPTLFSHVTAPQFNPSDLQSDDIDQTLNKHIKQIDEINSMIQSPPTPVN